MLKEALKSSLKTNKLIVESIHRTVNVHDTFLRYSLMIYCCTGVIVSSVSEVREN